MVEVEDPVINNLLSRLKRNINSSDDVLSRSEDGGEDDPLSGSGDEELIEATDYVFYLGGFNYDLLIRPTVVAAVAAVVAV